MALNTNLFPPIVDTYAPAFVINNQNKGNAKVYFSISKYNNIQDIQSIWVSITNQYTNQSAVPIDEDKNGNSSGLLVYDKSILNIQTDEKGYFIEITDKDLIDECWILNQFYKIQIRFCSLPVSEFDGSSQWVIQNSASFSEWSSVCLLQAIQQPILTLKTFESNDEVVLTSLDSYIVGNVDFKDREELESYSISLFKQDSLEEVVYFSGIVYSTNNEINHFMNYALEDGERYLLRVTYTTRSQYAETKEYKFSILTIGGNKLDATITAEPDDFEGYINVKVQGINLDAKFVGNIVIRRTSSSTNFKIWEDVYITAFNGEYLNIDWKDFTVESGVLYKYCAQQRTVDDYRSLIIQINEPVMVTLQNMFLTGGNRQLKIEFNPKVTSYKRNLSDSVTQTIGGKYPFIKRNGILNYRQFSVSGLISHLIDEKNFFMSKEKMYKDQTESYLKYNKKHRISEYNDFTLERTFREEVESFLIENNIKLFRSASEGNILVRLTDVSLAPQETLGRMLYTFTATAHEIDEATISNYDKYNIQTIGEIQTTVLNDYKKDGQYTRLFSYSSSSNNTNSIDIVEEINKKESQMVTISNTTRSVENLSNVKIEIVGQPYLINTDLGIITSSSKNKTPLALGYLAQINGQSIIIPSSGVYSIQDDNIQITSLKILTMKNSLNVTIDYTAYIKETQVMSESLKQISYESRVGQVWGGTNPDDDIIYAIQKKYDINNANEYQELATINTISVEADPRTVFYLKDGGSSDFMPFEIGDTGFLHLEDYFNITNLYFLGFKVNTLKDEADEYIRRNEWVDLRFIAEPFANTDNITQPVEHGVYRVRSFTTNYKTPSNQYLTLLDNLITANKDYYTVIYENGAWYPFVRISNQNSEGVIVKSLPVIVNYECELERGSY